MFIEMESKLLEVFLCTYLQPKGCGCVCKWRSFFKRSPKVGILMFFLSLRKSLNTMIVSEFKVVPKLFLFSICILTNLRT